MHLKTTGIGSTAESAASDFIESKGFKILARNWKTRVCEIDIVALKDKTVYFAEVKYRRSGTWGEGLEYITPKKLKQMRFAAEIWVSENEFDGDYCLSAIEVSGEDYKIGQFIENCI